MTPTLTKSYVAGADVAGRRIVKFAAAAVDASVVQGTAATDPIVGVSDAMGAPSGGMLDVHLGGIAPVQLGGVVASGDPLTADANGKAVKCEAAAGQTRRFVGFAQAPGVADDVVPFLVAPGIIHAP